MRSSEKAISAARKTGKDREDVATSGSISLDAVLYRPNGEANIENRENGTTIPLTVGNYVYILMVNQPTAEDEDTKNVVQRYLLAHRMKDGERFYAFTPEDIILIKDALKSQRVHMQIQVPLLELLQPSLVEKIRNAI